MPVVIQGTIVIKQSLRHPSTVMFGPPLARRATAQRGRPTVKPVVDDDIAAAVASSSCLQRRTQAAIAAGCPRDLAGVDAWRAA